MPWNASRCIVHHWPDLGGFHMNITEADMTPELEAVRIEPTSPNNVWAGDPGVPQTLPVFEPGVPGKVGSIPNPDWTPESPKFTTVFLLFASEAEARELAPHLWVDPAP